MTITQRIQALPANVKRAFQPEFIFILTKDTIQHFPIRQWSHAQIKEEILARYKNLETMTVDGYLVCYESGNDTILIVPKVATFAAL